jgi:hypothetical protein
VSSRTTSSSALIQAELPAPLQFGGVNLLNSLARYLGDRYRQAGYLNYWHAPVDAVETADGWYPQWSTQQAMYQGDPAFHAQWVSARGLMTLVTGRPAVPRRPARLIDDHRAGPAGLVTVPVTSIELVGILPTEDYELGTKRKWRARHLAVSAYARDEWEQRQIEDWWSLWFEDEQSVDIADHAAGTLALIGSADIRNPAVVPYTDPLGEEAATWLVTLNARVVYVA